MSLKETDYTGHTCTHCLRACGTFEGGFARVDGQAVCSRPRNPDRPDCYRMVTEKHHPLRHCRRCLDTSRREPLYPPAPMRARSLTNPAGSSS